ncbi:RNA polymerase sigma factor [Nonomuraea sp. NPDC050540]|uniref:RNA polymerase sigma factor n=1 Tax=Nonomuraea sp. NPDC050540 TaxID=3364367 RepID=UPI0037873B6B
MDDRKRPSFEDVEDVDEADRDAQDQDIKVDGRPVTRAEIEAFSAFYRDHFLLVVKLVMLMYGASRQEAEDAAQQAFTEMFLRWKTITFPNSYVRTTAMRACWRARKRTARTDLSDQVGQELAEPDDVFDTACEYAWVEWVIQDLPPRQQQVIRAVTDGLGYDQIAALLGTNEANVRSHLRHVRNSLKNRPDLLALVPAARPARPVTTPATTPGKGENL